jgi:hypothetical protein
LSLLNLMVAELWRGKSFQHRVLEKNFAMLSRTNERKTSFEWARQNVAIVTEVQIMAAKADMQCRLLMWWTSAPGDRRKVSA